MKKKEKKEDKVEKEDERKIKGELEMKKQRGRETGGEE